MLYPPSKRHMWRISNLLLHKQLTVYFLPWYPVPSVAKYMSYMRLTRSLHELSFPRCLNLCFSVLTELATYILDFSAGHSPHTAHKVSIYSSPVQILLQVLNYLSTSDSWKGAKTFVLQSHLANRIWVKPIHEKIHERSHLQTLGFHLQMRKKRRCIFGE